MYRTHQHANPGMVDLVVIWLDLSHVYRSISHKVVDETLRRYNVPQKVMDIIKPMPPQVLLLTRSNKRAAMR